MKSLGHFQAESIPEQYKEVLKGLEMIFYTANLTYMLVEVFLDKKKGKAVKISQCVTLMNQLFRQHTGKNFGEYYLDGKNYDTTLFPGVERICADMGASLIRFLPTATDEVTTDEDATTFGREGLVNNLVLQNKVFKAEAFIQDMEYLHSLSTDFIGILQSEFGSKLITLTSLLLCLPALKSIGFSPENFSLSDDCIRQLYKKYDSYTMVSLPATILEHSTWVMIKFSQMWITAKDKGIEAGIRSLFISRGDFTEFENEYLWLKVNSKNFSCCSEVVNLKGEKEPFTLEGYNHRCVAALDNATTLISYVKEDLFLRNKYDRMKSDIALFHSLCAAEARAGESRPFPYAVMLTGTPSVGKSMIKDVIIHQLHATDNRLGRFEVPYKPEFVYTYNSTDDFYSGFSTTKTTILLDDVAQKTPDIAKAQGGDDIADMIRIINCVPFLPNQAELEKKGKTPMRCRYVLGTTNSPDLNVHFVYKTPAAVYRRMLFVSCDVKPEYCEPGTTVLRGDIENPENLDLWNFCITKYYLHGNHASEKYWNGTKFDNEKSLIDIEQLVTFLDGDLERHWEKQDKALQATLALNKSKLCEHNISSLICTKCPHEFQAEAGFAYSRWRDIRAYLAFIPLYTCFIMSFIYLSIFPKTEFSHPIRPLRWALYWIQFLPEHPSTQCFSFFSWLPSATHNWLVQSYWLDKYGRITQNLRNSSTELYDWYRRDVLKDWRFPAIISFIGSVYVFMRIKGMFVYKAESQEVMPKPTKEELERRNHWQRNIKLGDFPPDCTAIPELQFHKIAILNTVLLEVTRIDGVKSFSNGLLLGGNLCVTVAHSLREGIDTVVMHRLHQNGDIMKISFKLGDDEIYIDEFRDLLFFKSNKIWPSRSLFNYLDEGVVPIHINGPGRIHYFDHRNGVELKFVDAQRISNEKQGYNYDYLGRTIFGAECFNTQTASPTHVGVCGAPVIVLHGNHKMICGIHTASNGNKHALTRPLTRELVGAVQRKLKSSLFVSNDADVAFLANSDIVIKEVHDKCPTWDMDGEYFRVGSHNQPRVSPKTMVRDSPICDETIAFFNKSRSEVSYKKYVSPIMCKPKLAIKLSMEKAFENAQFTSEEINFCVKAMSKEFLSHMTEEDLDRIKPYPMSAAINGVDGVPYVDRLNLKTSGGFGHGGPKRKLFSLMGSTDEHEYNFTMNDDLYAEFTYIYDRYKNNEVANPVFKCSFKDEPISQEKALVNKVRIFSGSPAAFSIFARKYLLCVIREFVGANRLNFEMAIGANAHGLDWDEIYHHVVRHGEGRCFAGDYKNFDKQMPPEIILAAFEVIKNILRAAKWHDDDLNMVEGIALDTAFPTMDLFGTIIKCHGNNPSGHILTTPINSLANSLYMRIACRRILIKNKFNVTLDNSGVNFTRFKDIMSLVTYGDDNCGSTSDKYPCINHRTIQEALAECGIIYTTDDKEAESKGLVHVDNITFLKRRFVFHDKLKRMVAPLDEQSLYRALTVWTYSKTISQEEQLAAVIDSVNREYFFHGDELFQKMHKFLYKICVDKGVMEYLPDGKLNTLGYFYETQQL